MRRLQLLLAVWSAICVPRAADALSVVAESLVVAPGSSGSFDVYVDVAMGEVPPALGGWQGAVDLGLGSPGLQFDAPFAVIPTAPTRDALLSANFSTNLGGNDGPTRASATAFLGSGGTAIIDDRALFSVPFTIALGTEGNVYDLLLDLDPFSGVVLSDDLGAAIRFTGVSGTIRVTPEPSTAALVVVGIALMALVHRGLVHRGAVARGRVPPG